MKNLKVIILAAALIFSITSCKDKTAGSFPREAYSRSSEGAAMKSAPDAKSQTVTVIPFAEKVTLTEYSGPVITSSDTDKTKWYKTQWNGKSGWVQESAVGGAESVTEQIKTSFAVQRSNFTADFVKAYDASSILITGTFSYPGGEMEPAKIFFLSGGIMVLNSKIFTENYSNTFFHYEFLNEGKLLKIKFTDSKLNFTEYSDMESSSDSVFKIDKNDRTIIYQVKDNGFFFFNWGFYKD
ncbi:MAG TPA: SH3 domain-containing protein [Spirochaetota bacterium]|nr:SH3 domain-containing protein [Spirochaetota bacterium]